MKLPNAFHDLGVVLYGAGCLIGVLSALIAWPFIARDHYTCAPQAANAGGNGGTVLVVVGIVGALFFVIVCGGILVALFLPVVQVARQAQSSKNNLTKIGLALHNYHGTYLSFPPARVTDADGKPLYSGRVLLLPFLEQEALYEEFDKTKTWDSPENQAISQTVIPVFVDPSSRNQASGQTNYLFATGKGTVFEAGNPSMIDTTTK